MKFGYYLVFGYPKENLEQGDPKPWEEFAEAVKAKGMELLFWGGSFGTSEDLVAVLKGDVQSYQGLYGTSDGPGVWAKIPLKDQRTVFVSDPRQF